MSRWAQCNHKGPYKQEAGGSEYREAVRMEAEICEERRCYTAFKMGERVLRQGINASDL